MRCVEGAGVCKRHMSSSWNRKDSLTSVPAIPTAALHHSACPSHGMPHKRRQRTIKAGISNEL